MVWYGRDKVAVSVMYGVAGGVSFIYGVAGSVSFPALDSDILFEL